MLTISDIEPGKLLSVKIAVCFAKDVLHIFESECPEDLRPRLAIEAAEKYLDSTDDAAAAINAARAARAYADVAYIAAEAHSAAYAAAHAASAASDATYAAAHIASAVTIAAHTSGRNRAEYTHQKLLELLPMILHHKMEHLEPFGNLENVWKYLTEEQKEEAIYFLDVLRC